MILVILGICILLFVLGITLIHHNTSINEGFNCKCITGIVLTISCTFGLIASLVFTCRLIDDVSQSMIIDERIAMYQEENKSIENSINIIVENYQDYEKDVFANAKNESIVVIATQIYPELKSNELVKKQLDIYVANNKKIKQLKTKKLDYKISKWWLYFGG